MYHIPGRTVGSSTTNTGNTCDGTTGTPGFGTGLVASLLTNGIGLPFVLRDALCSRHQLILRIPQIPHIFRSLTVHLGDNVQPDGCGQNRRKGKRGRGLCESLDQRLLPDIIL